MRVVIVGAGQAGASAAQKLRALRHEGPITLVGDEAFPPYQRPPLSKGYLLGELPRERLFLRPADFWAEQKIALVLGQPVLAIDRARKSVILPDRRVPYDALILTTGGAPRRLPAQMGGALRGVHVLRTLADVDHLRPELEEARKLLIIGGGYIGLEVAAVARKRGLDVVLVEAAPRILARVACAETAAAIRALHEAHGVEIHEGVAPARLLGRACVEGAELADGRHIDADLALVGIGITPNVALAKAAGLEVDDGPVGGIVVNDLGQSSDPAIWAAGDCAQFPLNGARVRLESVQNAIDQAEAVAANILGAGKPYQPIPWFWSDQFDLKLQIVGLNRGYDHVVVREGPPASHWYFRQGRLIAVDSLGDARAYMVARRLLAAGISPDPAQINDPTVDLRALLDAA